MVIFAILFFDHVVGNRTINIDPLSNFTLNVNCATMRIDDFFTNRKP